MLGVIFPALDINGGRFEAEICSGRRALHFGRNWRVIRREYRHRRIIFRAVINGPLNAYRIGPEALILGLPQKAIIPK